MKWECRLNYSLMKNVLPYIGHKLCHSKAKGVKIPFCDLNQACNYGNFSLKMSVFYCFLLFIFRSSRFFYCHLSYLCAYIHGCMDSEKNMNRVGRWYRVHSYGGTRIFWRVYAMCVLSWLCSNVQNLDYKKIIKRGQWKMSALIFLWNKKKQSKFIKWTS